MTKEKHLPINIDSILRFGTEHIFTKGITVQGNENIPQRGPMILTVNHMGILEFEVACIIASARRENPDKIITILKEDTIKLPIIGHYARKKNWIPINRKEFDGQALKKAIQALRNENILLIFPEGTRGREIDGNRRELKQIKSGTLLIAYKAANDMQENIPIIPCAIWGTEWFFPEIDDSTIPFWKRLVWKRLPVKANIGSPILITPVENVDKKILHEQTEILAHTLRDLLPKKYHGVYRK